MDVTPRSATAARKAGVRAACGSGAPAARMVSPERGRSSVPAGRSGLGAGPPDGGMPRRSPAVRPLSQVPNGADGADT